MELRSGATLRWFFLAMACWQKGDKDKARSWYDKAAHGWRRTIAVCGSGRFRAEAAALLGVTEHPTSAGKKEEKYHATIEALNARLALEPGP